MVVPPGALGVIALCFVLAGIIATLIPVSAWLTYRLIKGSEDDADIRVAQEATEGLLAQAQFRITQLEDSLKSSKRRESILDQAIAETLNANPGAALSHNDVLGRIRLYTAEWARESQTADDSPGPVTSPTMSEDSTTEPPESPTVSGFRRM